MVITVRIFAIVHRTPHLPMIRPIDLDQLRLILHIEQYHECVNSIVGLLLGVAGHLGACRGSLGIAAAHEPAVSAWPPVTTATKRQKPLERVEFRLRPNRAVF